jgi:hypothetical protein
MMKRVLSAFIALIFVMAAFALTSCRIGQNDDSDNSAVGVSIVDVEQAELEIGGVKYNRFTFTFSDGSVKVFNVESKNGADGDDGEKGEDG